MSRLTDAWKAIFGPRPPSVPRLSGVRQWGVPGAGVPLIPPQAGLDYRTLAGDLSANSVVAICLGWLADNFVTSGLEVGVETDGEFEDDDAHPLAKILHGRPNPIHSWRQVWGATVASYKVDGNAYWIKGRSLSGAGPTTEVFWVANSTVEVWPAADGTSVGFYRYTPIGGTGWVDYPPSEVIHFRDGIDPTFPLLGCSRLKKAIRLIAGLNAGETYTAAILRNYGVTPGVLVPKEAIATSGAGQPQTPEEAELQAEAKRIGRGTTGENSGRPYATTMPLDFVRYGMGPEEVMLDRILDRPESTVCAALGVNPMVVALAVGAEMRSYANQQEADKQTWHNGLIPMQDALIDTLKIDWLSEYEAEDSAYCLKWDRSKVEALSDNADAKMTRAVQAFQAGLLPRGRSLGIAGEEPMGEPDDSLYATDPTPKAEQMAREIADQQAEQQEAAQGQQDDEADPGDAADDAKPMPTNGHAGRMRGMRP